MVPLNIPGGFMTINVIALLLAVVVLVQMIRREFGKTDATGVRSRPLLTTAELHFLNVLREALPDRTITFKVSVGALLRPATHLNSSDRWSQYDQFASKTVDFVVVDPVDSRAVMLIELDHDCDDAVDDATRDEALSRAGYDILRFDERPAPTVRTVRDRLHDLGMINVSQIAIAGLVNEPA